MCLLMVCLPGETPDYNHICNAANNNPDGFGYAVHHGDRIVTGRGMNAATTIDRFFDELARSKGDGIGMFHARMTTHGSTITENCHPFRVGGRKDIVLAHNGMLPIHPKQGDIRSDTRIFAEDVLPNIGLSALDSPSSTSKLEDWASGSKLVILSTAPELKDQLYILNESLGTWDKGIWWSNSSYKYVYPSYKSSYSGGLWSTDDLLDYDRKVLTSNTNVPEDFFANEKCYLCLRTVSDAEYDAGYCQGCNSCLECYEHMANCLCYTPAFSAHKQDVQAKYDW